MITLKWHKICNCSQVMAINHIKPCSYLPGKVDASKFIISFSKHWAMSMLQLIKHVANDRMSNRLRFVDNNKTARLFQSFFSAKSLKFTTERHNTIFIY